MDLSRDQQGREIEGPPASILTASSFMVSANTIVPFAMNDCSRSRAIRWNMFVGEWTSLISMRRTYPLPLDGKSWHSDDPDGNINEMILTTGDTRLEAQLDGYVARS